MAQVFDKEYFRQKQAEKRERDIQIYKFHGWQRMPGESDKDFRRRFTKRTVIVIDNNEKIILDCFGDVIKPKETENTS